MAVGNMAEIGIRVFLVDQASAGLGTINAALGTLGTGIAVGLAAAFLGFGAAIAYSIAQAANLQNAFTRVQIATGATGQAMRTLEQFMLNLGGTSVFSLEQIANAMALAAQYGFRTVPAIEAVTTAAVQLATAINTDPVTAMRLLAGTMQAFQIPASQAQRTADMLFYSIQHGTPNLFQLQAGLAQVAGTADVLHISLADLIPAFDVLSPMMGGAAIVGTALRYALARLADPTKGQAAEQRALGFSAFDATGHFIGFNAVITELYNILKDKSPADQFSALANLVTVRGAQALMGLITHYQQYEQAVAAFNKANQGAGQVFHAFTLVMQNFGPQLQTIKTNLQDLAGLIGLALIPMLQGAVTWFANLINQLRVMAFDGAQAMAIFLVVGFVLSGIALIVLLVVAGFGMLMLVILGTIAVVMLLAAGITWVIINFNNWRAAGSYVGQVINVLLYMLQGLWAFVVGAFNTAWQLIIQTMKTFGVTGQDLINILKFIGAVLLTVVVIAILAVVAAIAIFIVALVAIIATVAAVLVAIIGFVKAIPGWLMWLHIQATTLVQAMIDHVKQVFTQGWADIVKGVSQFAANVVQFFKDLPGRIAQALSNLGSTIVTPFQEASVRVIGHSVVPDMINAVVAAFAATPGRIMAALASLPGQLASLAGNAMHQFWQGITNGIPSIIGQLANMGNQMINQVRWAAGQMWQWGANAMWQFAQGLASQAQSVVAQVQWAASQVAQLMGFHSPPKAGPLADSDQWMPNMMKMLASGVQANTPLLQSAVARAASGIAGVPGFAGGPTTPFSTGGAGGNQVIHNMIYLDGRVVYDDFMTRLGSSMQLNGLGRSFR